jgi:D-alanyl-D-alanine carboxypeptidase (penicillin-binding protein 5/6)
MKNWTLRAAAAIAAAALFLCAPVRAEEPCVPENLSAQRAILMDAATGRVLYEKNADEQSLIASTTKIMTGLLAAESGRLQETCQIPPEAVGIEGSSLYLKAGEELTLEQLLYGTMLRSGNDAAMALALALAGNEAAFVAQMNEKAAALGLKDTHFANPHGLDHEGNYSTARDLAKLACAALENPVFRQVVSTKEYAFGIRCLVNHNKLLWRYEGAIGVKTGYTKAAGRLLVSAAERDGRRLVAVTMDAPNDWADHAALLDYGFSAFTSTVLAEEGQMLGSVPVICGQRDACACRLAADLSVPLLPGEQAEIRLCLPRFVFAPVEADSHAGWAVALVDGQEVAREELRYGETVAYKAQTQNWLERLLGG